MMRIEIDFEVYKALTARLATEETTYNEVIRGLLGLSPTAPPASGGPKEPPASAWVVKSVRFPEGTQFRATYKGTEYTALVQGGRLMMNGRPYKSPSAAAIAVTGGNVNGWRFWECNRPEEGRWRSLDDVRREEAQTRGSRE